jgi:hypothetical protein
MKRVSGIKRMNNLTNIAALLLFLLCLAIGLATIVEVIGWMGMLA